MGLCVSVGMLADLKSCDPEAADYLLEEFQAINAALAEEGIPPHVEPETLPPLTSRSDGGGFSYSSLHNLRRVFARVVEDPKWVATPVADGEDPVEDEAVDRQSSLMYSHLLCHSDAEGFYLPVDFEEPIFGDEAISGGGMIGSSKKLMEELQLIAPSLGITLNDGALSDAEATRINKEVDAESTLWIELMVWITLFEAARLSLEHKTAICFN